MRTAILSLFVLLPALASAQQGLQSYTPEPTMDAPTFINAEVVRVNRDNTATFRSESGEVTLTANASTAAAVGALRAGDKVLVEYREVRNADGRLTRFVTSVKPASSTSGEPGRVTAAPAVLPSGTTAAVAPASNTGDVAAGGTTRTEVTTTTTTTGTVGSPVVVGGTAPGSPYTSTVPSIPATPPVAGVVLPPAGAKEPLSAEEVGLMRAQGERDLEASAVALAAAAAAIDPVWVGFKNQCLTVATDTTVTAGREWFLLADDRIPIPADDACRTMFTDLTGKTRGFLSQRETVEDAARKADVLPARVREVLDRHKL